MLIPMEWPDEDFFRTALMSMVYLIYMYHACPLVAVTDYAVLLFTIYWLALTPE